MNKDRKMNPSLKFALNVFVGAFLLLLLPELIGIFLTGNMADAVYLMIVAPFFAYYGHKIFLRI